MILINWKRLDLDIKKLHLILIICIFSVKISSQNKTIECWEAKTSYNNINFKENNYKLEFKNDSVILLINNSNYYKSKLYNSKKNNFFFISKEKMVIKRNNDSNDIKYVKISYYYKKRRISVNEITTLKFNKCP